MHLPPGPPRFLQYIIQLAKSRGIHTVNIIRDRPDRWAQGGLYSLVLIQGPPSLRLRPEHASSGHCMWRGGLPD